MSFAESNFHPAFVWAVNQTMAQCPGSTVGSGYRTVSQQAGLLYKRAQGIAVADPGSSRHNGADNHGGIGGARGGAVDMQGDYDCLPAAGARFGIHQGVPGEAWHFEFTDEAWAQVEAGTYQYAADEAAGEEEPAEDSLEHLWDQFMAGGPDMLEPGEPVFEPDPEPEPKPAQGADGFVPEVPAEGEGALSAVEVAQHYANAGFTGEALVTMVAISKGESGWDTRAGLPGHGLGDSHLANSTWGRSLGLSQVRSLNAERGTGGWRDADRLTDPAFNARAAFAISNGGTSFTDWTVYNKGLYQQYVGEARAAVQSLGAAGLGGQGPPAASIDPPDEPGDPEVDTTIHDPVGTTQEIAEMMAQMGDPGEVTARAGLKSATAEDDDEEPVVALGGD